LGSYLVGLYEDLRRRSTLVDGVLQRAATELGVAQQIEIAQERTRRVKQEADVALNAPDLTAHQLRADYVLRYKRWSEDLDVVESEVLPMISRRHPDDSYLSCLCQRLITDVKYPLEPPAIWAGSREYYFARPEFNIIGVPSCEPFGLLSLPDLAHELGHILYRNSLEYPVEAHCRTAIRKYVDGEKRRLRVEMRPPDLEDQYRLMQAHWESGWIEELACDVLASLMAGPAYGWAHIRLSTRTGEDIYGPGFGRGMVHPADHARLRVIIETLKSMGFKIACTEIMRTWDEHVGRWGTAPASYRLCYPDGILREIVTQTQTVYQTLGLSVYSSAEVDTIPAILNQAWNHFLKAPHDYPTWEEKMVSQLRSEFS
jgi:hypothetical protein